jgi:capsule polysaccharide export protein KpsC/LpsZ
MLIRHEKWDSKVIISQLVWAMELQFGDGLHHLLIDQEAVETELRASIWIEGHPDPGDAHPDFDPSVISAG